MQKLIPINTQILEMQKLIPINTQILEMQKLSMPCVNDVNFTSFQI